MIPGTSELVEGLGPVVLRQASMVGPVALWVLRRKVLRAMRVSPVARRQVSRAHHHSHLHVFRHHADKHHIL